MTQWLTGTDRACSPLRRWKNVTFSGAAPDAHTAIDAAYHAKYDRYGTRIVGTVTGPDAENTTFRLEPRD